MVLKKKDQYNSNEEIDNYLLNTYGIRSLYDKSEIPPDSLSISGYTEISSSNFEQINMLFNQIPGLALHELSHHGTYRVYFDKGLGVLQQAKEGNGFVRGNIVEFGTNNNIKGSALWKAASSAPLIANTIFSAMSTITGQYFLSEINSKLSLLDKKIDEIRQFLEMEKTSKVWANEKYLQQVIRDYSSIQSNDYLKQATIQMLQQIRIDSLSNINFYSTSFQIKKEAFLRLKKKGEKKDIPPAINDLGNLILCYKYVTATYSLAYYLEMLISGNTDQKYLSSIKSDIIGQVNNYNSSVKMLDSDFKEFLNDAKAYKANELIKDIGKVVTGGVTKAFFGSFTLGYTITDAINEKSDDAKTKAKNAVVQQAESLIKECNDLKPFERITKGLAQYNQIINNSQIELVYTDNKAYIKFTDIKADKKETEEKASKQLNNKEETLR
ncbi:hypothetical protein [Ruminococcus sp. XPD3002]|uniref:hypothetical protein n=1 Tax=Ruminococcus sp. XPD3002 TaxID=1452269 RepID=UPI00091736B6|nr:hypothetical protein SAMN04487832_11128 [Ruminococcus flavefaciens]